MASYRLLSYAGDDGQANAGILVGDSVFNLASEIAGQDNADISAASLQTVLDNWDDAEPVLRAIADNPGTTARNIEDVKLCAPIARPTAIYCAAANYYDHAREMGNGDLDKSKLKPYFFIKSSSVVIGPGDDVRLPQGHSEKYDWEVEINAIVGREARNLTVDNALDCLAGYCILNDLSARDHVRREDWPFGTDWFSHKSWDTSCSIGPWITPASEIGDVQNLDLKTWISGKLMQESNSDQMVFSTAELLVSISSQLTLKPGDMIATGTCAGVGAFTGTFLKPGDDIRMEVEGLGELKNPVVAGD